jgi:hypothetical protein
MGVLRTAVGVALVAAPGVPLRMAGGGQSTGAARLLMRTIGVRDLVLGVGMLSAAGDGDGADSDRWTRATLASDALDTVLGLLAVRSIGRRDAAVAAGLAAAFVYGDVRALRAGPGPVAG